MRGIHRLKFSQTQKVRLQKALKQLESLSVKVNSDSSVVIADSIPVNHEEDGVLKGHGTDKLNGEIVSTLCGVVERVDKLVYVRPLRSRYKSEDDNIVIGRVIEVAQKYWRLDIDCSQNACLMLSAMNMPDGVQRRRTALDELNMRCIFEEADVICAEVSHSRKHDELNLQARSQKYGKLSTGQLLKVTPYLVKRHKQHFHHLDQYGIDLIIGHNGLIWVGEHIEVRDDMVDDSLDEEDKNYTALEIRQYICRAANAIRVLSTLGFMMTLEIIKEVIDLSLSTNIEIHDMLGSEFYVLVAEKEAERRCSTKNGSRKRGREEEAQSLIY